MILPPRYSSQTVQRILSASSVQSEKPQTLDPISMSSLCPPVRVPVQQPPRSMPPPSPMIRVPVHLPPQPSLSPMQLPRIMPMTHSRSMVGVSTQSGPPQPVEPGAQPSTQLKDPPRLRPDAEKPSDRVSIETKLQHLQQWFEYAAEYRKLTGGEPVMRTYEKTHGFPKKYISRLLASRERMESMPVQTLAKRFNLGSRPFYPVEILLVKMIDELRVNRIPIEQRSLQLMAHEIYTLLVSKMGTLQFNRPTFSISWVYSFRKYWKIDYYQLQGEAGSVDMNKYADQVDSVRSIVAGYPLENVYNADETGLFLQTLSKWTLGRERTSGYKSATSRVSILFCVNATGTDKRKPLILSRSLPNGYHKDSELQKGIEVYSLQYEKSKTKGKGKENGSTTTMTGYMTSDIFLEWLQQFQQSIVSENPSRRILLLLDNASCHTKPIKENSHLFPNIQIQFLPPNTTSVTQPLDAGVIAVFKLRYRQIISDKTILLRLDNDRALETNPKEYKNPWSIRVSNLGAWNAIVRAWSFVRPESIRNCFCHVPILCDDQKSLLRGMNGTNETRSTDPCVLEAVVSRRDIDDLIDDQAQSNAEGSLRIPYQYTQMPSLPSPATREERSEWIRATIEKELLLKDAMLPTVRHVDETLERCGAARLRVAQVYGLPTSPIRGSRPTLQGNPFSVKNQEINVSDVERDRATTLAAALDGSPFLCRLINEHNNDEIFMSYFKPALTETILLGGERFPSDEDMSDSDYSASMDGRESITSVDSTFGASGSDAEEEVEQGVDKANCGKAHSILIHAAGVLPKEYSDLSERLEVVADGMLGPEFFDADASYVSRFKEEQRKKEHLYQTRSIHDARLKKTYPQVNLPVKIAERSESDMEICSEDDMGMCSEEAMNMSF